jgi:hypothetical protein
MGSKEQLSDWRQHVREALQGKRGYISKKQRHELTQLLGRLHGSQGLAVNRSINEVDRRLLRARKRPR